MFIRYYVVRNIVVVGAIAAVGTALATGGADSASGDEPVAAKAEPVSGSTAKNARPTPRPAATPTPRQAPPAPRGLIGGAVPTPSAQPGLVAPPYTAAAVAMLRPANGLKKIKDGLKRTGAKVNIYNDDQDGTWDRAKVDTDRDGSWDGKLTRKNGAIELKLNDAVFIYRSGAWAKK